MENIMVDEKDKNDKFKNLFMSGDKGDIEIKPSNVIHLDTKNNRQSHNKGDDGRLIARELKNVQKSYESNWVKESKDSQWYKIKLSEDLELRARGKCKPSKLRQIKILGEFVGSILEET